MIFFHSDFHCVKRLCHHYVIDVVEVDVFSLLWKPEEAELVCVHRFSVQFVTHALPNAAAHGA